MTQTAAMRLLNVATTTGDGPVFNLEFPQLAAAVQAEIAGAPTQAVINVMALLDGGTWDTLCVLDISQGYVSGEIQAIRSRRRSARSRAISARWRAGPIHPCRCISPREDDKELTGLSA